MPAAADLSVEELRVLCREKDEAIKRKEKKLELLRKAGSGEALREAETRMKRIGSDLRKAKVSAEEEIKKTLSAEGVPLAQKKDQLTKEIEAFEREHEEQEARIAQLDADVHEATRSFETFRTEKRELCETVICLIKDMQATLSSKMEEEGAVEQKPANQPYILLQAIAELTKDRESEVSNNERQLREICQIIKMKKKREEELQVETDEAIRLANSQKDEEVLQLVNQCGRERQDIIDTITRLQKDNDEMSDSLHWKHQKTLRDVKDRKIDRSGKRAIREQIVVPVISRKKGAKKSSKAKKDADDSKKEDEEEEEAEQKLLQPKLEVATRPPNMTPRALVEARREDPRETEKLKLRKMEGEMTKLQTDFQRSKRQMEYKISYERGQAEQFERENQKLEAQAEHLAQTLQAMKAEVKKRAAAAVPAADGGATPRRASRSPRPSSGRR